MKISLATNFDNQLIEEIKKYPVYEVYGKMNWDIIGGGRASNSLINFDKKKFEDHVKKVRDNGINFNYLLNGSCLQNLEQSKEFQNELKIFLKYLKDVGVNALTITNPYILEFVKKYFNNFIVRISTFACVDNFAKTKYWEDLGADIICVDFVKINRDFKMLKYMVNNLKKAKIEILVTNSCLKDCPYIYTHTTSLSHASQKNGSQDYEDWCLHRCQSTELNNLEEYIKSPWVRPEDICEYEKIGIEHFKITERGFPTEELVKRLKAYCDRTYNGNLLDLIQGHGWGCSEKKVYNRIEELNSPDEILEEIKKIRGLGCKREYNRHIYIDNSKFNNFIDFFTQGKCHGYCKECNYCKKVSQEVISVDEEVADYLKQLYQKFESLKM